MALLLTTLVLLLLAPLAASSCTSDETSLLTHGPRHEHLQRQRPRTCVCEWCEPANANSKWLPNSFMACLPLTVTCFANLLSRSKMSVLADAELRLNAHCVPGALSRTNRWRKLRQPAFLGWETLRPCYLKDPRLRKGHHLQAEAPRTFEPYTQPSRIQQCRALQTLHILCRRLKRMPCNP